MNQFVNFMNKSILPVLLILLLTFSYSCKETGNKTSNETIKAEMVVPETDHPQFVSDMEEAHMKSELLKNGVVCFNLDMTFGSNRSQMKIFTTPTSSAIRVDKKEGPSTVVLNGEIYTDADSTRWQSERFGVYTYQYFFMAPYKFSDKGTIWKKLPEQDMEGKPMEIAKLTFEAGTGDAPDDWYIVYADDNTNLVNYIGYIVTGGGRSIEDAEKNAHAIKYSEYKTIDNIPFATKWEFFKYSSTNGLGDKIGEGTIKNIEMMDYVDQFDIIQDGSYTKI